MRVLVTGGCGFIGSHIAEYHIKKGDEVHVVDDLTTGNIENLASFRNHPSLTFNQADIVTWADLTSAVYHADRIYHMAAVVGIYRVLAEPIKVIATNIAGCERILRAIHATGSRQRIIIASSSEIYGHSLKKSLHEDDPLIIESAAQPRWSYAISKLADESLGIAYFYASKVPITMARFFNTIGPRQTGRYGMVVPRFVKQACRGEPLIVFGDGTQTRSFCDVRDVVVALDNLANNHEAIGEIVNVGNDREISINSLAKLIRDRAQSHSAIEHISYEEAYAQPFIDIMRRHPDLTKFTKLSGFKHQWTLEQTIDDLIKHYLSLHSELSINRE